MKIFYIRVKYYTVLSRKCVCKHGYTGEFCDTKSTCETDNLCLNGGNCTQLNRHALECECPEGFFGDYCQHKSLCHSDYRMCGEGTCHFYQDLGVVHCETTSVSGSFIAEPAMLLVSFYILI